MNVDMVIRKLRFLLIFVFLLAMPLMAFAQYFRNLNVAEGLPNSVGKCFVQDGQGLIWVGTFNGLARYDGYRFTTYRHIEGDSTTLSNSHVESLCYDGKNGLWIGTKGGIDYMSLVDRKITHCRYVNPKTKKDESMPASYIWKIMLAGNRLWAVNAYGQLFYKHANHSLVWKTLSWKGERVKGIAEYDGKYLWVLTDEQLRLMDAQTLQVKASCAVALMDKSCLCNLYYSRNHHLLFVGLGYGYPSMAFSVSRQNVNVDYHGAKGIGYYAIQQVNMPLPSNVKAVTDYADMTLFATDGQGLKAMKNGKLVSWIPQYDKIAGSAIHSLFVDKSKSLWLGTYREGICLYSPRFDYFKGLTLAEHQLNYKVVSAVSGDDTHLYIGTDGGGLNVYDRISGQTQYLTTANSGLPGDNVVSLLNDGELLWMGIYGKGICVMDKKTRAISRIDLPDKTGQIPNLYTMWRVFDTHEGRLLFKGERLYAYHKQTGKVEEMSVASGEKVGMVFVDGYVLWVATAKVLEKYDLRTNRLIHSYSLPRQMEVSALYVKDDRAFFAENNSDLYELDARKGKVVSIAEGLLANQEVESILGDNLGNLWLGTDKGLVQYRMPNQTFKSYDEEDHLLQNQFSTNAVFSDGKLFYFGSTNGLVAFEPSRLSQATGDDKVFFDDFFVLGDHQHLSLFGATPEKLELSHEQNFFTISFSVAEFLAPHKQKFRYKLEGLDKEWREIEDAREVSYTNVSPGSYTFLIQTTNGDGTWSEHISKLPIHISQPWYFTWWARALWLLIIIGVIYAIFRHYAEKQKMKHEIAQKEQEKNFEIARKEQEKQHELAQKELEKQMIQKNNEDKLNFFANITHELRTPMFLITAPLEELLSSVQRPVQVPYSYLRGMYRNAVRLNKLVNSILDLRKMEAGTLKLKVTRRDMVKVCKRLSVDYRALCLQKNIKFCFETDLETLGADVDIEKLELILSNLVANAYKYTNEGGQVTLRLLQEKENKQMKLLVSDTGIGIAKDQIEKVFERYYRVNENSKAVGDGLGLAFVKNLVELHGGTISVESEEGKGSTFTVTMPLSQPEDVKAQVSMKLPIVEGDLQLDEAEDTESVDKETDMVEGMYQSPTATQAILIIDDERETIQLLERYLGKDYKIFKAGDGEEGLRMAADVMPDLVICDVMMPKMDGFEFLGKFKDDKKLQHIPVIMFTAKILDEDKIAAFRYGADAYLTKPISLKFLKARIESFLNKNASAGLQNANLSIPASAVSGGVHYSKEDQKFILRCKEIIDKHMCEENFGVDYMAEQLGMSHSALYKKVKAITGKSAVDMIVEYRIFKAVEMMRKGETNVTLLSERCGFNDIRSFRSAFKSRMGMPPKQFIQQL